MNINTNYGKVFTGNINAILLICIFVVYELITVSVWP